MSTLKTHNLQSPDAGSVNIAMAPNAGMVVTGISTFTTTLHVGGDMGLGTNSPASSHDRVLTIAGTNSGELKLTGSNYGVTDTDGADVLFSYGGLYLINNESTGNIHFHTGSGVPERLRIASNGGIGIATDKIPRNYFLHIAAPSQDYTNTSTQLTDGGGIMFQHTDTLASTGRTYPGIFWSGNTSALGRARAGIIGVTASNNDATHIAFLTRTAANGTSFYPADERMRITNTGQLLIGTTSGSEILCIKKDNNTGPTITLENNANKAYINNWGSSGGGSGRTNRFEINATLQAQASYCAPYHTFMTGNAGDAYEKVRIASSGDVGIGVDSPPCKLAIRDTAEFTAYGGGAPTSTNIMLQLWNNPPNETANDHASMQLAVNGGTHNRVSSISAVAESAGNRKLALAFCTDDAGSRTEKMRISGDGYVTKPETPSWVMRPSYSSNQTLGSGTHAIGWTSSDYNTHAKGVRLKNVTLSGSGFSSNLHNGQNVGKITVPVAGIYYVWCTIRMENQNNAGNIYLYVDGSQIVRQHVEDWNDDRYIHGRIQHIVYMNANSYIIWALNCNGGVVSGINDTVNWCGGHLIG